MGRDKVTGTGGLSASEDDTQPVHNTFDFRIRTLCHIIISPASSCG